METAVAIPFATTNEETTVEEPNPANVLESAPQQIAFFNVHVVVLDKSFVIVYNFSVNDYKVVTKVYH